MSAVDDHSLHPPFIYNFYRQVINPAKKGPRFPEIIDLYKTLSNDSTEIEVEDLGAGSAYGLYKKRSISDIAKRCSSPAKVSRLLYQIGVFLKAKNMLELGTSLGVNTAYLAQISAMTIHTIEGSKGIHQVANNHLKKHENVIRHQGNINDLLEHILSKMDSVDMAYFDANHTYEATLTYFDQVFHKRLPSSVFIIGDIHWSTGMEDAWKEIIHMPEVTLSIDLFHCGLVFFLPVREKQHYVIAF